MLINFEVNKNKLEQNYYDFFSECIKENRCGQEELCKKYKDNCYTYNHSLIITKNYFDDSKKNKLLIIGLEKTQGKMKEICTYDDIAKNGGTDNQHWKATLKTIIKVNDQALKEEEIEKMYEKHCKDYPYCFAFTNYYKCAFSKDGNWSGNSVVHSDKMTKNCGECLEREIKILNPDLIIKQGKWGKADNFFKEKFDTIKEIDKKGKKIGNRIYRMFLKEYKYKDKDKKFYVIEAYHPCIKNSYNFDGKKGHKKDLYSLINEAIYLLENKK